MQSPDEIVWSVSDFVAVCNQTLEFAYPVIAIHGEVSNFKVSKNRWVYFDLKDEFSSVRFFGSVYNLNTALEDGMMVKVQGSPRLHPQFGFSVTFQMVTPVGEGSIKRAADILQVKLQKEGIFDLERKRRLPYFPSSIGLVASLESAAYKDFVKILSERWTGISIEVYDVQVQGDAAIDQIVRALEYFNTRTEHEVVVMTRGGGSADDLAAFSSEQITRAIAASRIPTLVAIGHEIDVSLAELAADVRASTPSNAAQILFPDKKEQLNLLSSRQDALRKFLTADLNKKNDKLLHNRRHLYNKIVGQVDRSLDRLHKNSKVLELLHPQTVLKRGYALVRQKTKLVTSVKQLHKDAEVVIELSDGSADAIVVATNGGHRS